MSAPGSISSPHNHDQTNYTIDSVSSMHDQVAGQLTSGGQSTVDVYSPIGSKAKACLSFSGAGLRGLFTTASKSLSDCGHTVLAKALAPFYVEINGARLTGGIDLAVDLAKYSAWGPLKHIGPGAIEYKQALQAYGLQPPANPSVLANHSLNPTVRPKLTDGLLLLRIPLAGLDLTAQIGQTAVSRDYDQIAAGEPFAGFSSETPEFAIMARVYARRPHMQSRVVEEVKDVRLIPAIKFSPHAIWTGLCPMHGLFAWVPLPRLNHRRAQQVLNDNLLGRLILNEWLSCSLVFSRNYVRKAISHRPVAVPAPAPVPVPAPKILSASNTQTVSSRVFRAFLRALFEFCVYVRAQVDTYVLCPNRYDVDGKIGPWHRRFYNTYTQGIFGEMATSPHNLAMMRPGDLLTYEERTSGGIAFSLMFTLSDLLSKKHKKLFERKWMTLPMQLSCVTEWARNKERGRYSQFHCRADEGRVSVYGKNVLKLFYFRTGAGHMRALKSNVTATRSQRQIIRQTLSLESVYPIETSAITGALFSNAALANAGRDPLNPAGLTHSLLYRNMDGSALTKLLLWLREQQTEAGTKNNVSLLARDDRKLALETVDCEYQWSRKVATPWSAMPAATPMMRQATYARGVKIVATSLGGSSVSLSRQVFVRTNESQTAPFNCREQFSIDGCFGEGPHGTEELTHLQLQIDVAADDSLPPVSLNEMLRSLGSIGSDGQSLPLVDPARNTDTRELRLEARVEAKMFLALRSRLLRLKPEDLDVQDAPAAARIEELIRGGLAQADHPEAWVYALGNFVCESEQPNKMIAFLARLSPGVRFSVAEESNTGAINRINAAVRRFENEHNDTGEPPDQQRYSISSKRIAHAVRLEVEINTVARAYLSDPYVSSRNKLDGQLLFTELDWKVKWIKGAYPECFSIEKHHMCDYLIDKGITTEDDLLVGQSLDILDHINKKQALFDRVDMAHADVKQVEARRSQLADAKSMMLLAEPNFIANSFKQDVP